MSHVTSADDLSAPLISGRTHFLLRRLHSLTGIVFGLYIVIHLFVNATLLQGTTPYDVYQAQVDKIHSLPFLVAIEWSMIYLPIIYHTIYGLWITFTGHPNPVEYPFAKNWFYLWQRISAIVLIAFILFHVLGMKGLFTSSLTFDPERATATTINHINAGWAIAFLVYPIGILAACFHLANGFWSAAITWGLTITAAAQKRWGIVCIAIFAFTFGCGMTALITAISRGRMVVH